MNEPCPSVLIESDLKVWRHKLSSLQKDSTPIEIQDVVEKIVELKNLLKIAKDYESNPITKAPPFEEPKQYDIGFIPTLRELQEAFQQMPCNWPGDTYSHKLTYIANFSIKTGSITTEEKLIGTLTFTKLDGQWVYFGPTKYK